MIPLTLGERVVVAAFLVPFALLLALGAAVDAVAGRRRGRAA